MKKTLLNLIALFEITTGLLGLIWVAGGLLGYFPRGVISGLWFGVFPVISVCTGILFWRRWRTAFFLSLLVLILQTVVIKTTEFTLNLTGPLNVTINGIWNARAGFGGAVIGINVVALVVTLLLLSCRSAFHGLPLTLAMATGSRAKTKSKA
jgi:hypothetical protein